MTEVIDTFKVMTATQVPRGLEKDHYDTEQELEIPQYIPWQIIAPHAAQARKNHSQSLKELNSRGGLSPQELLAVLNDTPYRVTRGRDYRVIMLELSNLLKGE